jgi:phosphatidylglycerophosphate synthase
MKSFSISILSKWEYWLKDQLARRIPLFFSSRKLTFLSLVAAFLAFLSYYFAKYQLWFIWLASLFILAQWVTDTLDGEVGRYRKEGFVKWGLYVDHFFDYIFFTSVVFGLYFVTGQPEFFNYFLIIFALGSAFFIHAYLYASATGKLEVSAMGMSGTELRFLIILLNTVIFFFGRKILDNQWLYIAIIAILSIVLVFIFIKSQNKLAKMDMQIKKQSAKIKR